VKGRVLELCVCMSYVMLWVGARTVGGSVMELRHAGFSTSARHPHMAMLPPR
jgi:hypothetical protein